MVESRRDFYTAHLTLFGWEPVVQGNVPRIWHPDIRSLISFTTTGFGNWYATVGDVHKDISMQAGRYPGEWIDFGETQLELAYQRSLEIQNEQQDGP